MSGISLFSPGQVWTFGCNSIQKGLNKSAGNIALPWIYYRSHTKFRDRWKKWIIKACEMHTDRQIERRKKNMTGLKPVSGLPQRAVWESKLHKILIHFWEMFCCLNLFNDFPCHKIRQAGTLHEWSWFMTLWQEIITLTRPIRRGYDICHTNFTST